MNTDDEAALRPFLDEQFELYPDMEELDLYKVLHQRCLGPGHAIDDPADAFDRLVVEVRSLDLQVREWEQVLEYLDEEAGLVRVHLRPWLRAGGSLQRLFDAFERSARHLNPDPRRLEACVSTTIALLPPRAEALDAGFDAPDFRQAVAPLLRAGYPAHSHSDTYRDEYEPAYRVLLRSQLES